MTGGQADFANKYIGGGVIANGCVQEEIRLAISPEGIVCRSPTLRHSPPPSLAPSFC